MLFVLPATFIKMLKPLAVFAAVLFATSPVAADPVLEAIIAGRLKLNAQLQQCHIEVAWFARPEKNFDELQAALAKEEPFTGTIPPARMQFLKDGDRWQHISCYGISGSTSISDQLSKAANAKQRESGKSQLDSSTTAPGKCLVYFSDGSGLYGTGGGTSVFNLQMDDGNIVNAAKFISHPDVWAPRPFTDSAEQICHPLDPVLSAVSAAIAKTRSDVTVEQITTSTGPLVRMTSTTPTFKLQRDFLLDPSRSYATVSEHTKHPNGTVHYCRVIEWHDGKNFPKRVVALLAKNDIEHTKPDSVVYETHEYHVTRSDLNKAPDFGEHPIEVAEGVQFNTQVVEANTGVQVHKASLFRIEERVTLQDWGILYKSLFMGTSGSLAERSISRPTKPGTSYAVWGLLAAGVACIIAAIWTLRSRSR